LKASTLASAAALALAASLAHASTAAPYTARSAPDAVSKGILAHHYASFHDGATGPADNSAAIHRNFAKVIEQNLAQMPAAAVPAWLDQMSDAELQDFAQLYVNANADAHRNGAVLQVFAARVDGKRLGRLAQFFGYQEMNEAVLAVAPLKAQAFAASASVAHPGPVPGAALMDRGTTNAPLVAGVAATPPTKPTTDMTVEEIYHMFRTLPDGARSIPSAIYETLKYTATEVTLVGTTAYGVGTLIVYLMKTYTPDYYYGTFIDRVGNTIDYASNAFLTLGNLSTTSQLLNMAKYEDSSMPVWGLTRTDMVTFGRDGGDRNVMFEYADYMQNYPVCSNRWNEDCRPVQPW
jgi:hypothetical protein